MEWREPNEDLLDLILKRDVYTHSGDLLLKKGNILNHQSIQVLKNHPVEKILVSITNLEKELSIQLETLANKSTQPYFWESYINLIEEIKKLYKDLENGKSTHTDPLILKLYQTLGLLKDPQEFFEYAYQINGSEDSLYRHSVNVSIISYLIGMSGISYDQPFVLAQMGLFHDIGKTMLNQDVLNKPTILTNAEQTYIQHHTTIGLDALKKVGIYSEKIKESVLLHHENRTGNGYPFGYSKESIPFSVQVISVADTFDSIASDRVYKKHKPLLETFNELYFEATKGKLHPLIVLSFIEETMKYFLNHKIILSNGEIGIIYYNNPLETIRPIILLEDKSFIDLSQNRGIFMVDFI